MRRANGLFSRIASLDNLRLAFLTARRGKQQAPDVREFSFRIDTALQEMRRGLLAGDYPLGRYRQFVIHDPKERLITAPCFPERVLHHAIMNVCEPVFERALVFDTFACRQGKGHLAALERARGFSRRCSWFLQLDVRKYFDSIPHDRLMTRLTRLFRERALLELFARILATGSVGKTGLPIGSLMSQHFANQYLAPFDRFVKEDLCVPGFVRYMDDSVLWSDSKPLLRSALARSEAFLRNELALTLKPAAPLNRTALGMTFLGARVYPDHSELPRTVRVRLRRKLVAVDRDLLEGRIDALSAQRQGTALLATTRHAGLRTWRFRHRLVQQLSADDHEVARTG